MTTDVMAVPPATDGDAEENANRLAESMQRMSDDELAAVANHHHNEHSLATRSAVTHARDAGRALLVMKQRVLHGRWGEWVRKNFKGKASTARLYMQVARGWGKLSKLDRDGVTLVHLRKLLARPLGKKPSPGAKGAGSSRVPSPPPPATDSGAGSQPGPAPTDGDGDPSPSATYKPASDESLKPHPDEDVGEFVVKLSVAEKDQADKWMKRLQRKLGTPNRAKTLMEVVRRVYLQHFPKEHLEAKR